MFDVFKQIYLNSFLYDKKLSNFLPKTLDYVDAAIFNTTFAKPAELNPQQSLAYTNVIVTTRKLQCSTKTKELVSVFQSAAVLQKAH